MKTSRLCLARVLHGAFAESVIVGGPCPALECWEQGGPFFDGGVLGDDGDASGDAVRSDPAFEALPDTDPHARVVGKDVADALREALAVMTAHQARCLRASLCGLNGEEAAAQLDRSGRGVRHALLRARRTFEAVASQRGYDRCH